MRALVAIVLAACAPMTRYNVTVSAEPGVAYRLSDVDDAIDALDLSMSAVGLVNLGDTEQILAGKFLVLRWRKAPFMCGDVLAMGCKHGRIIEVVTSDCAGNSAVTHELTHALLEHITPPGPSMSGGKAVLSVDGDPRHELVDYWRAASLADLALRQLCTTPQEVTK